MNNPIKKDDEKIEKNNIKNEEKGIEKGEFNWCFYC